jgi:hypothetical protein
MVGKTITLVMQWGQVIPTREQDKGIHVFWDYVEK